MASYPPMMLRSGFQESRKVGCETEMLHYAQKTSLKSSAPEHRNFTTGSVIIWAVFVKTDRYKGMLTGTYTGRSSAEMSLAAGLGANVLVGGSSQTVALQPLSVQGQIGLDIAAGVGSLDLHPRGDATRTKSHHDTLLLAICPKRAYLRDSNYRKHNSIP